MEIWGDWVMPIHHLTDNEGRGERNMQHAHLTTWQVTKHYHYCAVHNKLQQPAQNYFWWLIAKQVTNKCLSCSWTLHIAQWSHCSRIEWDATGGLNHTLVQLQIWGAVMRFMPPWSQHFGCGWHNTCSLQSSTWTADTSSGGLHVAQLLQEANVDHPAEAWSCRKER